MSVLIILGSKSDLEVGKKAKDILDEFGVKNKMVVASAHRTSRHLIETVEKSDADVFIAIAGLSAALPGAVAAHTTRPVIGVPVNRHKRTVDDVVRVLGFLLMRKLLELALVGLNHGLQETETRFGINGNSRQLRIAGKPQVTFLRDRQIVVLSQEVKPVPREDLVGIISRNMPIHRSGQVLEASRGRDPSIKPGPKRVCIWLDLGAVDYAGVGRPAGAACSIWSIHASRRGRFQIRPTSLPER